MKPRACSMALRLFAGALWLGSALTTFAAAAPVTLLTIDGAIGPATADYVVRGLARSVANGSQLVVLRMDTPGGLDASMRQIIKAILASPVPVAGYVAPSGARAASAGTYILYASHIAAMANGTNLGAATPVQIGGGGDAPEPSGPRASPHRDERDPPHRDERDPPRKDARDLPRKDTRDPPRESDDGRAAEPKPGQGGTMTRKQVNDAAAYIRGLAQLRGRNAEWAEQAVREAVSLSAQEALKLKVIDYVAMDLDDLSKQLDGKPVRALGTEKTLVTANAPIIAYEPDWRTNLLSIITNPSVALILMMIGVYGLIFEFTQPGLVAPGVVGIVCLLLGMFALQMMPINYAGLGLIGLGLALMVAEAFLPSFGSLGIGGIIAFVIGTVILIDTDTPGYGVSLALVIVLALISFAFVVGMAGLALRARRRPVVSGREELIGSSGVVVESSGTEAWARIHGELWRVKSASGVAPGQRVTVIGMEGLTLNVILEPDNQSNDRQRATHSRAG